MTLHRLSLKTSTIISVVVMGAVFIASSWVAGNSFRNAALAAQIKSLSRIIEVAAVEVLRQMDKHALNLNTTLNSGELLSRSFRRYRQSAAPEPLIKVLDDPFITGFPGFAEVELSKLRIYDLRLEPLVESRQGVSAVPFELPRFLYQRAIDRRGADRLKAVSGLWLSAQGPLYSVLLPIGGLHIEGYLEVVFNPRFNLTRVSSMIDMPLTILSDEEWRTNPIRINDKDGMLNIEFELQGQDGKTAYHLIGHENINTLQRDTLHTQITITVIFLTFIFLALLLALWLLRLGLFAPLRNLLGSIEEYSRGNLETRAEISGLKELRTLGQTFNDMLQRIRDDIRELERLSTIDGLTGIANRRYFDKCLEHEISHGRRRKIPLSMLYIDIDYFKLFNDYYGHQGGDEALQRVAHCIEGLARRETDVAARLGGEEFAILLPDTEAANARIVAEALLLAVSNLNIRHEKSQVADHITLSIGVATITPDTDTCGHDLISRADEALYRAKAEGRNRVAMDTGEKNSSHAAAN